jgi:hypothetical protein
MFFFQERGISDIWGNIKDKFNDFGDWTRQFLGDVWGEIEPSLIEVRDMAKEVGVHLIVDDCLHQYMYLRYSY